MLRIYGTITSPFVRRVRIVAVELGLASELIDTNTADGQQQLRALSPIWKVPTVELDGQPVLDSHTITELLVARHAAGPIAPLPVDDLEGRNAISVIDGALDSLVNVFLLARDGVLPASVPYLQKQHERAGNALGWLEARMHGAFVTSRGAYGLPEIALGTALSWMRFRNMHPLDRFPRLMACVEQLEQRPSFAGSRPPG